MAPLDHGPNGNEGDEEQMDHDEINHWRFGGCAVLRPTRGGLSLLAGKGKVQSPDQLPGTPCT